MVVTRVAFAGLQDSWSTAAVARLLALHVQGRGQSRHRPADNRCQWDGVRIQEAVTASWKLRQQVYLAVHCHCWTRSML